MAGVRSCRDCEAVLPLSAFPVYSHGRGRRPMCRKCFNDAENARRKNRHKHGSHKPYQTTRYERYKERFTVDLAFRCEALARSCKYRANKKKIECGLTGPFIHLIMQSQGLKCAKTGVPFDFSPNKKYTRNPHAPSIDRKDNFKGYTLDNVQIVTVWYNMLKNEWSDEDVRNFVWVAFHTMFGDNS